VEARSRLGDSVTREIQFRVIGLAETGRLDRLVEQAFRPASTQG